jgi:inosine-uridine nucleoside N-ribohydrolase
MKEECSNTTLSREQHSLFLLQTGPLNNIAISCAKRKNYAILINKTENVLVTAV